jgi:hypothetical protein
MASEEESVRILFETGGQDAIEQAIQRIQNGLSGIGVSSDEVSSQSTKAFELIASAAEATWPKIASGVDSFEALKDASSQLSQSATGAFDIVAEAMASLGGSATASADESTKAIEQLGSAASELPNNFNTDAVQQSLTEIGDAALDASGVTTSAYEAIADAATDVGAESADAFSTLATAAEDAAEHIVTVPESFREASAEAQAFGASAAGAADSLADSGIAATEFSDASTAAFEAVAEAASESGIAVSESMADAAAQSKDALADFLSDFQKWNDGIKDGISGVLDAVAEQSGDVADELSDGKLPDAFEDVKRRGKETESELTQAFDRLSKSVNQLASQADNLGDRLTRALESPISSATALARTFTSRFGAIGIAAGAVVAGVTSISAAVLHLGSDGARLNDVARGFETLAGGAENANAILEAMREGTASTVDDVQLMTEANKLMQAGFRGTAEQFKTLTQGAQVLSRQGFGSIETVMNAVDRAIQTGSTRRLALMGITIDATRAELNYADAHGVSLSRMTEAQKREALRAATIEAMSKKVKEAGDIELSLAQRVQQVIKWMGDFADAVKQHIDKSGAVKDAFLAIQDAWQKTFGDSTKSMLDGITGAIDKFANLVAKYGPMVVEYLGKIRDWVVAGYHAVLDAWQALPDWLKEVVKQAAIAAAAGVAIEKSFSLAADAIKKASGAGGGGGGIFGDVASSATILSGTRDTFYSIHEILDKIGPKVKEIMMGFGGWMLTLTNIPAVIGAISDWVVKIGATIFGWARGVIAFVGELAIPLAIITAIGIAVYEIYKNWDVVGKLVSQVVDNLKSAFDAFTNSSLGNLLVIVAKIGWHIAQWTGGQIWNVLKVAVDGVLLALGFMVTAVSEIAKGAGEVFAWFDKWVRIGIDPIIAGLSWIDSWFDKNADRKLPTPDLPAEPDVKGAPAGPKSVPRDINLDDKRQSEQIKQASEDQAQFAKQVREAIEAIAGESKALAVNIAAVKSYIASRREAIDNDKLSTAERLRAIDAIDKLIAAHVTLDATTQKYYEKLKDQVVAEREKGKALLESQGVTLGAIESLRQLGYSDEAVAAQFHVTVDALKAYENALKSWQTVAEGSMQTEKVMLEQSLANKEKTVGETLRLMAMEQTAVEARFQAEVEGAHGNVQKLQEISARHDQANKQYQAKITATLEAETLKRRRIEQEDMERQLSGIDLQVAQIKDKYAELIRNATSTPDVFAKLPEELQDAELERLHRFQRLQQEEIDLAQGASTNIIQILKAQGQATQKELDAQAKKALDTYNTIKASTEATVQAVRAAFEDSQKRQTDANGGVAAQKTLEERAKFEEDELKRMEEMFSRGAAGWNEVEQQFDKYFEAASDANYGFPPQEALDRAADKAQKHYDDIRVGLIKVGEQEELNARQEAINARIRAQHGVTMRRDLRDMLDIERSRLAMMQRQYAAGEITKKQLDDQKEKVKELNREANGKGFRDYFKDITSVVGESAQAWAQLAQASDGATSSFAKFVGQAMNVANVLMQDIDQLLNARDAIGAVIAVIHLAVDAVALLWDAFTTSPGEDVKHRVAQNWGTEIGEELGDKIAEVAKKRFGGSRQAAELFNFSDILNAAGGLSNKNVDTFAARFHDIFSMFDQGKFTVAEMTKAINDNIQAFADLAALGNVRAFQSLVDTANQINERFKQGKMNALEFADAMKPALDALAELGTESETAMEAFGTMATRVIDDFQRGAISASQANKLLDTGIGVLADNAKKNGGIVSQAFLDIAKAAKAAGLEVESLKQFNEAMFNQLASGLDKAVSKIDTTASVENVFKSFSQRQQKELKDAYERSQKGADATKQTFEEFLAQQANFYGELKEGDKRLQTVFYGNDLEKWNQAKAQWQGSFDRLTRIALASYNAMVASGKSPIEAIMQLGDSLDKLIDQHNKLGLRSNAAYDQLARLRTLTKDNAELVESVAGLNDVLVALANTGGLDAEVFADLEAEGVDSFKKLQAAGFTERESLAQMVPFLQSVIKAHKERGLAIDEETQKMIDQAREQGVLSEEQLSTVDVLKDGLSEIIKLLGGDIPEAWKKAADAAKDASADTKDATDEQAAAAEDGSDDASKALEKQRRKWEEAEKAAKNAADTAQGGLDDTTGSIDDVGRWLEHNQSDWYTWRDAAVDAANDVYDAVHAVSYGHSPGGIKDIIAHLRMAMDASKVFSKELRDQMEIAKQAVDAVKPTMDWSTMSSQISKTVSAPPPQVVTVTLPQGSDADAAPRTFVMNVNGRTFAEVTVDALEASATPYARMRTIVKQMVK